jgi:AraC-like DNA-binding protein
MLLMPDVWHRYSPNPETGWHEHWVGFDGEIARRWMRHAFAMPKIPVLRFGDEDTVLPLFAAIMQVLRDSQPEPQQPLAGVTCHLIGLLCSAQKRVSPGVDNCPGDPVTRAILRMQTSIESPLCLQSLAQELSVSYRWLRRAFAQRTGLGPHQYLLELRLARARSLLADTSRTVKEIAAMTGFQDEHYFSRVFQRRIGFSPSGWRAGAQASVPSRAPAVSRVPGPSMERPPCESATGRLGL